MKHHFWFNRHPTVTQSVPQPRKHPPSPFDRAIRLQQATLAERECPITFEKILDAAPQECVIFIDGNIYKKQELLSWLRHHPISPSTNLALNYYSKFYNMRVKRQTPATTRPYLYPQAAVLILIAFGAVAGIGLLTTRPLHSKATQAYVVGILFCVFFLSISYLCCCLYNFRRPADTIALSLSLPLFTQDTATLDDVYKHYKMFLLEYDPDYYLPQDNESETLRPTPSV